MMVVRLVKPLAELLPLLALAVFLTVLEALPVELAVVLPLAPPPPAASTAPVVDLALLNPVWPAAAAAPVDAWPVPWLLTFVVFLTVTLAALLEPAPIDPPVAMLPLLLLVTVTFEVAPVADALPLPPLPVFEVALLAEFELDAVVPEPLPAPPAPFVAGALAVVLVFPV